MFEAGYLSDVDLDEGTTMNKKIRNAQLAQYNFIFGEYIVRGCQEYLMVWLFPCIYQTV